MDEFQRIVVGLQLAADGNALSLGSQKAVQQAIWLAKANGGSLALIHSTFDDEYRTPIGAGGQVFHEGVSEAGQRSLEGAMAEIRNSGLEAELEVVGGRPWLEISRKVLREESDLVIVGKRNEATEDGRRLGNVALKLLRKCPSPVWVVRPEHDLVHRLILAATDLSAVGDRVVRCAARLAERHECDLHVLHAWQLTMAEQLESSRMSDEEHTQAMEEIKRRCVAHIATNLGEFQGRGEPVIHTSKGAPARMIRDAVKHLDPDLLVMGTISRTGVAGMLLGSTAERMLDRVDCSILTLKPEGFVSPITLDALASEGE